MPQVREVGREVVEKVHRRIPEFDGDHLEERWEDRIPGADSLCLASFIGGEPVGYGVCYDKFDDGSYYLWMAGVVPEHRRKGAMTGIVERCERYARENGYSSLKIKTRNENTGMRKFLAERGFKVCGYNEFDTLDRSEIMTVKPLEGDS